VSFALPQFSLDFVNALAKDAKLHIDIRRTIVSATVAYFKNLFVRNSPLRQADLLFAVLEAQFAAAKTGLGPTFCQLLRPKFCRQLAQQDPVYRELMPPSSTPPSLLAPQNFGELSMPRRCDWQQLFERYVDAFIAPSLLSKDEHVLQLVVQVLTKIGLRGGKVSEQVSKFVTEFLQVIPCEMCCLRTAEWSMSEQALGRSASGTPCRGPISRLNVDRISQKSSQSMVL
jgi:hypothetical protein